MKSYINITDGFLIDSIFLVVNYHSNSTKLGVEIVHPNISRIIDSLNDIYMRYGFPDEHLTKDNVVFSSLLFNSYSKKNNIKHSFM